MKDEPIRSSGDETAFSEIDGGVKAPVVEGFSVPGHEADSHDLHSDHERRMRQQLLGGDQAQSGADIENKGDDGNSLFHVLVHPLAASVARSTSTSSCCSL